MDAIGNRVVKGVRAEVIGSRGVGEAPISIDGKGAMAGFSYLGVAEGLAFQVGGGEGAVVDRIFVHGESQKGRDRRLVAQQQMHRANKDWRAGRWGCTQGGPAGRNQQHQHERGNKMQPSPFTERDGLAASG